MEIDPSRKGESEVLFKIKKMPTQAELEAFLESFCGDVRIVFNRETGSFEWLGQKPPEEIKEVS